jgi:hypothetical protein
MLSFMTTVMPLIASFDHIFDNHDILALMLDKYSTMAMPMLQSARVLTIR